MIALHKLLPEKNLWFKCGHFAKSLELELSCNFLSGYITNIISEHSRNKNYTVQRIKGLVGIWGDQGLQEILSGSLL